MTSKGFCIHAYNNLEIDYGTMSLCSALLIKKNLNTNSVTLITNNDTLAYMNHCHSKEIIDRGFDNIKIVQIDRDVGKRTFHDTRYTEKEQPYFNLNRSDTFLLSPYDETILIDSDYLVLDNSLDLVWGSVEDILINKSIRDLHHNLESSGFDKRFNDMSIPMYWATLMYFKKTDKCQQIFELIKFIKNNYRYYQHLYNFMPNRYFRNDYALSIAIHMITGQFENDSIKSFPDEYIMVSTEYDDLIKFKDNKAYFISEKEQGDFKLHKLFTNVHVMNKWSIIRNSKDIIDYASN